MKLSGTQVMERLNKQKFAWIDAQFRRVLPPQVYHGMHHQDPNALGWIKERGYRVEENGNVVTVLRGANVIARTWIVLELTKPEELDALVKSARIVPPQGIQPDLT